MTVPCADLLRTGFPVPAGAARGSGHPVLHVTVLLPGASRSTTRPSRTSEFSTDCPLVPSVRGFPGAASEPSTMERSIRALGAPVIERAPPECGVANTSCGFAPVASTTEHPLGPALTETPTLLMTLRWPVRIGFGLATMSIAASS